MRSEIRIGTGRNSQVAARLAQSIALCEYQPARTFSSRHCEEASLRLNLSAEDWLQRPLAVRTEPPFIFRECLFANSEDDLTICPFLLRHAPSGGLDHG